MFKKIILLLLISTTLFSCKVMFVPHKDGAMLVAVQHISDQTMDLYTAMMGSTNKTYGTYAAEYTDIQTQVDSVISVNTTRPKAGLILSQARRFQALFAKCKGDHQAKGTLNNGQLASSKKYLWSYLKPWLVSETSLK